jgi:hypothetical protein
MTSNAGSVFLLPKFLLDKLPLGGFRTVRSIRARRKCVVACVKVPRFRYRC